MANRLGTNDPIYDASRLNTINLVNGQVPAVVNAITALHGDATATGPGDVAITFATVNTSVGVPGTFGSSTQSARVTINAKGQVTAVDQVTIAGVSPVGAALARGSIYRGSAAGAVEALAKGSAGFFLTGDGTDTLWSTFALAGTAAQTYTFGTSGGTIPTSAGTLTVSTTNAVSAAGVITHAITTSANVQAGTTSILASNAGDLRVATLAVGGSPFSGRVFWVSKTNSADATVVASQFLLTHNPGVSSTTQQYGFWNEVRAASAQTFSSTYYGGINWSVATVNSANVTGSLIAGYFSAGATDAALTSVSIANAIGIRARIEATGGCTITTGKALEVQSAITSSGGVLVNGYGLYVNAQSAASTINSAITTLGGTLNFTHNADSIFATFTGHTTLAAASPIVKIVRNDSASGIASMLRLQGLGSKAANDAINFEFYQTPATGAAVQSAFIRSVIVDPTTASRKFRVLFGVNDAGGERDAIQIDTDGSSSDVQINSLHYGSMYADDIAQVVTIGSAGAYVKVPGSMTAGLCNGFTLASSRELTCTIAGTYKVAWSMSVYSGSNNEIIGGAAMVNTTEAHQTENASECINSGKPVSISGHGEITLAVNDVVALCVENETAAHDITVTHANLSVVRIGA